MATKKKKKEAEQPNYLAKALDIAVSVAVVAGLCYGGYRVAAGGVKIDQNASAPENPTVSSETQPETEPSVIYGSEEHPNAEVHNGPLILVNNFIPFTGSDSGLVSLYSVKLERESHSFSVRDGDLMVKPEMADALVSMLDAFYAETFDDNINVISGYRTQEDQQTLYDKYENGDGESDEASHRAAKPGFSEHQTGYGVDFELFDGSDYDGTGVYSWINEHCADYGLILRYPEDKFDLTNIIYEAWHYRYVGKPHAAVIMQGGMCLEEYIDYVKEYPYDGEHLRVTDTDGKVYEIYYYPQDTSHDSTLVPVPGAGASYTVQGNNVDGFIVTIDTGETGEPAAVEYSAPEVSSGEESAGEESTDAGEESADAGEESADAGEEDGSEEDTPSEEN